VAQLLPADGLKAATERASALATRSAEKIQKAWGITSHAANYGFAAAMKSIGGVVSTAADIVQNGVPKDQREVGALIAKNVINGVGTPAGEL